MAKEEFTLRQHRLELLKTALGIVCYLLGIGYYALSIARHIQF
jgi:hypothetical protein